MVGYILSRANRNDHKKTTNKVGNFKERAYFCKQKITKYVEIWIFFLELHKKHSFFIVNMNYSGLTANVL